jgi:putative sterol carrier protein
MRKILVLLVGGFLLLQWSCRRDDLVSGSALELRFSTDTVYLDTVFETIGSSTYTLKVFNDLDQRVQIEEIRLEDPASPFRLNINGQASNRITDVDILADDSIYIFIEVSSGQLREAEALLTDRIVFSGGGASQAVDLVSLARQAIFHFPSNFLVLGNGPNAAVIPYSVIDCNTNWTAGIPHLVYGYAVVDSGCTLTIDPGAEVYFHENSGLWVFDDGELNIANGALPGTGDSVTFSGDRLEPFYEDAPGQWGGVLGGLYIAQRAKASINNLVLKNAVNGLRVDSGHFNDQLKISNSYILNCSRTGFYGGYGQVEAENLVIANTGLYGFYAFGGNYRFRHCTFANYWTGSTRQEPAVLLSNFIEFRDEQGQLQRIVRDVESAYFGNCIIYGNNEQEFGIAKDESGQINYQFNGALLKLAFDPEDRGFDVSGPEFTSVEINRDPDFVNVNRNFFQLDSASQAIDLGNTNDGFLVPTDILGGIRNFGGLPDIGAYERQF